MGSAIFNYKKDALDSNGKEKIDDKGLPIYNKKEFADTFGVNYQAFCYRLDGTLQESGAQVGHRPYLNKVEEEILIDYCLILARMGDGLAPFKMRE
jgi:hypothetical protein